MTLRLATRRSPLAVAQATLVQEMCRREGYDAELVLIETHGDRQNDVALSDIAGQGVFAVEVQRAVLDGRADIAVHSAKDLPSETPMGLVLAAVPERRDPADVLVGRSLAGLGPGATVATGSPRRRALLAERRPDLTFVELRGNMATRLSAVERSGIDAVVAAAAALERLGWSDRVAERLDPEWCTPQVGQGALALEVRDDDDTMLELMQRLNNADEFLCVTGERAFLAELGAGCAVPAAAFATYDGSVVTLRGVMAAPDGTRVVRTTMTGERPEELGRTVARMIRDDLGGGELPSAR
ncbi:MAG: hydroxymethylbilane synthase [Acidobacteria bacterium]|nr:hydroxymethylbilane synthase [Acidobacteriota bacterium]